MNHHQKCLRRAKARREAGLPSHSQERKSRIDTAWRNIFNNPELVKERIKCFY